MALLYPLSGIAARPGIGPGAMDVGAFYAARASSPREVRPLDRRRDVVVGTAYHFAVDDLGRPAWPFRWLLLQDECVFAQRWSWGTWTYRRELDALWSGADDRWIATTLEQVDWWVGRQSAR